MVLNQPILEVQDIPYGVFTHDNNSVILLIEVGDPSLALPGGTAGKIKTVRKRGPSRVRLLTFPRRYNYCGEFLKVLEDVPWVFFTCALQSRVIASPEGVGPAAEKRYPWRPVEVPDPPPGGARKTDLNEGQTQKGKESVCYARLIPRKTYVDVGHIEDLTQEKFSLQRALEASRTLAESLAAENSSLTDSYNQQRSIVNRLKSDMESLQEEIKAQLVSIYYI
ncbi:hypothetical protein GOBAR_AA35183 [Gossypium barbadense]|uniref:Uncharacterized protein n=1 Tax=Gossypium barbadense TaxID=3634 RepID=A0A2P5W339_GOSBA|nr:hypothetical protein GOBAR_AA35183 [Gossypium barbadense]